MYSYFETLSAMDGHGCCHFAVSALVWRFTFPLLENEHKLLCHHGDFCCLPLILKDQRNKLSLNPKLPLTRKGSHDKWTDGQIQTESSIFVRREFKSTRENDWVHQAGKVNSETMKWVRHQGFESSLTPPTPPLLHPTSNTSSWVEYIFCDFQVWRNAN